MTASTSEFVALRDGPTLPLDAVLLAIDLDLRGIKMTALNGGLRVSGPDGKPTLSDNERASITKFKTHLLALVAYCEVDH